MEAVKWVYQFSILTSLVTVIQVPFNALIIAREKMNVFALISIIDVLLKLVIVYLLVIISSDKLILYSILVFVVTFLVAVAYRVYCRINFAESRFKFFSDITYYKELLSYSGWNLFGNIAYVSKTQGINLVLNIFFGTVVNAAYGITIQVQTAINVFVSNFQLAINPQIIKSYSQGDHKQTLNLIFQSCKFSFFLMSLLVSPVLLNTQFILDFWLKQPPPQTLLFVQLSLAGILIECISGPLMVGAQATGKIRNYQIIVGTLVFLNLPLSYMFLSLGESPSVVFIISIIITILTLFFRIYFLSKMLSLSISDFFKNVILRIILVASFGFAIISQIKKISFSSSPFMLFSIQSLLCLFVLVVLIFLFGVTKSEKEYLKAFLNKKILKKQF
jgi:O-antigen/teichoic acid export membrane protein